MYRSLHESTEVHESVDIGAKTNGTDTGAEVDCVDSDAPQFLIPVTGAGWTDGVHEVQFFHGDTSGSLVRVPTADLDGKVAADVVDDSGNGKFTVSTAAHDAKVVQIGYIGGKRFVRADIVTTGSTTGALLGVLVLLARLRHEGGPNPMKPGWA